MEKKSLKEYAKVIAIKNNNSRLKKGDIIVRVKDIFVLMT